LWYNRKKTRTDERGGGGGITFATFQEFGLRFPLAVYPLIQFQVQLQKATLGTDTWHRMQTHVSFLIEASSLPDLSRKSLAPPSQHAKTVK
jgi:hypothetical protein